MINPEPPVVDTTQPTWWNKNRVILYDIVFSVNLGLSLVNFCLLAVTTSRS